MNDEIKSNLKELGFEHFEAVFDKIIDNPLIQSIDAVGIFKLLKAARSVRDLFYLENIEKFILELEKLNEKEVESALKKWNKSEEEKKKVGKYLLMILDKVSQDEKIIMLVKIFFAYLKKKINKEEFFRISDGVLNSYIEDLKRPYEYKCLKNLVSSGFATFEVVANENSKRYNEKGEYIVEYKKSRLGILFIQVVLDGNELMYHPSFIDKDDNEWSKDVDL